MGGLLSHQPAPTEPCLPVRGCAEVTGTSEAAGGIPKGTRVKIMSWNLQFCAGRDHLFFYEGGSAVQVPLADIEQTMRAVADVIAEYQPDIVLLQEVDRYSRRSHYQDELLGILQHLDDAGHAYPHVVSTPYHQCMFVPTPSHEMLGRVDFHMAVLSKFPMQAALRHQLPLLDESYLRQQFNLKRALQEARFLVEGGGVFVAFNTHLSAFAYNDGTPEREVAMLDEHMGRCEEQGTAWVLAGDFNMLPPGETPERLGVINNEDHATYYTSGRSPIEPLCQKYRCAMDVQAWSEIPPADRASSPSNTYLPLGTDVADRVLDWVFAGSKAPIARYEVLRHRHLGVASDHLPLLLEVTL